MTKFIASSITGFIIFLTPVLSQNSIFKTKAAQIISNEDSLLTNKDNQTVISGYGSAFYQHNKNTQQASMNLERAVMFVGHKFNSKISLFTELEVENAKVEGGNNGEVAFEQAYLRFNFNPSSYLVAGLFVPRIGIINENHLPVNFNGVERTMVEQIVIPATWRELGIGYYGKSKRYPLNYSIALLNGLNSADFAHGNGIREGRYEGNNANATSLALTSSVQYNVSDFKFQVSGYVGGSAGLTKKDADSLHLNNGAFGTTVYLGEANIQYNHNAFNAKLLGTYVSIPDADKINNAYNNNVASGMVGAYAELSYDWLFKKHKTEQLISFVRYEYIDLNSSISGLNAIYDGTLKQSHFLLGVGYLPIPNVVIKADVRIQNTGNQNPLLSSSNTLPYNSNNQFVNIGIGYSF